MEPITLDQIKVFLTIVDAGSFSGAARRLKRAQSAVSYAISNLERLLSVALFDRSTRTPTLTEHGRALVGDARAVQAHVSQFENHARALAGGLEARIALAVDVLFPIEPVLSVLSAFRAEYPLVQVGFYTEALGGVVQQVLDETCQIGICAQILAGHPGLRWNHISDVELIPVVSSSHPLAALGRPVKTAELQEHTQIVISDRSTLTTGRDFGVISGTTWRVADLETKLACLRAGLGWGNMPRHRVPCDLAMGGLAQLRIEGQDPTMRINMYLTRRDSYEPGPCGRWLLDRITAEAATIGRHDGVAPRGWLPQSF